MELPEKKDDLFVLKHIGPYQTQLDQVSQHFNPDPN
jgi:hypothetical protein